MGCEQGGLKRDCDENGDVFSDRLVDDGNGGSKREMGFLLLDTVLGRLSQKLRQFRF